MKTIFAKIKKSIFIMVRKLQKKVLGKKEMKKNIFVSFPASLIIKRGNAFIAKKGFPAKKKYRKKSKVPSLYF